MNDSSPNLENQNKNFNLRSNDNPNTEITNESYVLDKEIDKKINESRSSNFAGENNNTLIEHSTQNKKFLNVLKNSLFLFLKAYGGRIVYSIFQFYSKKKQKGDGPTSIFSAIFNIGNLRTSLMVSCLPLFFDILKKFLTYIFKIYKIDKYDDVIVFISGFISSYLAICIEEKSKLLNYVVLAIVVRVVHSYFLIKYKEKNLCQGKFWDFLFFFIAAILMIFTNFLNPSFQPITSLFDSYANFINSSERDQMYKMREIYRIV